MDVLSIKGLSKRFGNKTVLDSLDLTVPEHSIFAFVGRNGSGKTTTMKSVLGLIRPDSGEIHVMGEPVRFGETPTNKHIGYLPDVPNFYTFMTPIEYLRLVGQCLEMDPKEAEERSLELLKLVGLEGENKRIKGFSRGMKQRLGIAVALLGSPSLLICDEPTSALDPIGRKEILDILLSIKDETTVIFSTHILSDVERIATDVALISDGRIALSGKIGELMERSSGESITIEFSTPKDAGKFSELIGGWEKISDTALAVRGGDEKMDEILTLIVREGLKIRKIERTGTTLESLFVEVTGK